MSSPLPDLPVDASYADRVKYLRSLGESVVGSSRHWNNSMYFYEDSVVIFNPETETVRYVSIGIDVWDSPAARKVLDEHKNSETHKCYHEYLDRKDEEYRQKEENRRQEERQQNIESVYAHWESDTAEKLVDWLDTLRSDYRDAMVRLMKVKKPRSEFRKSLRKQVIDWLNTPETDRKYPFPLSLRQMEYLY